MSEPRATPLCDAALLDLSSDDSCLTVYSDTQDGQPYHGEVMRKDVGETLERMCAELAETISHAENMYASGSTALDMHRIISKALARYGEMMKGAGK